MTLTFNELRRLKHSLPKGSMRVIANDLNLPVQTVRNYFGATDFENGDSTGIHVEPGPDGGMVHLDDTTILEKARAMVREKSLS
ncbi:MAG: DNA-binding protein [Bacteroidota bacterium]